ncbi:Uu.00g095360.m01.CDS01 [Anthostomella pinea]|uniref:Uu.00g095360.m01.CDS01 n=1 Tax=Anthostomella pinea TaxID=933095 RepID=A0AAI8VT30_9PEZI|nr:Uu.00g095360.m01.CDS01 [Anthostomella pinea]
MTTSRREYAFRAYSNTSAGALVSGRGPRPRHTPPIAIHREFDRHRDLNNRVPTSLVSVSRRVIDTLRRAFNKHYRDNEPADQIWIAIIRLPEETADGVVFHKALDLAAGHGDEAKFTYEIVFEWEIPEHYVEHRVSVQTLIDRGLDLRNYRVTNEALLPAISELRSVLAKKLLEFSRGGNYSREDDCYDTGVNLAFWARDFGARAPTRYIANQMFNDLLGPVTYFCGDDQRMRFSYCDVCFEFSDLCHLEDGMKFVEKLKNYGGTEDYDDWLDYAFYKWRECVMELECIEDWFRDRATKCTECTESIYHEGATLIASKKEVMEEWKRLLRPLVLLEGS